MNSNILAASIGVLALAVAVVLFVIPDRMAEYFRRQRPSMSAEDLDRYFNRTSILAAAVAKSVFAALSLVIVATGQLNHP